MFVTGRIAGVDARGLDRQLERRFGAIDDKATTDGVETTKSLAETHMRNFERNARVSGIESEIVGRRRSGEQRGDGERQATGANRKRIIQILKENETISSFSFFI